MKTSARTYVGTVFRFMISSKTSIIKHNRNLVKELKHKNSFVYSVSGLYARSSTDLRYLFSEIHWPEGTVPKSRHPDGHQPGVIQEQGGRWSRVEGVLPSLSSGGVGPSPDCGTRLLTSHQSTLKLIYRSSVALTSGRQGHVLTCCSLSKCIGRSTLNIYET
jgi:hypothetical protein